MGSMRMSRSDKGGYVNSSDLMDRITDDGTEPGFLAGNGIRVIRLRRDKQLGPWSRFGQDLGCRDVRGICSTVQDCWLPSPLSGLGADGPCPRWPRDASGGVQRGARMWVVGLSLLLSTGKR